MPIEDSKYNSGLDLEFNGAQTKRDRIIRLYNFLVSQTKVHIKSRKSFKKIFKEVSREVFGSSGWDI